MNRIKFGIIFSLFCILVCGCHNKRVLLKASENQYLYTIDYENDFQVEYYHDLIAVSDIKSGLNYFSSLTQLYSLSTGELYTEIKLETDDWETGFYSDGYYAISLLNHQLLCYDLDGKQSQLVLDNKVDQPWSFAMLSEDGKYVIYGESKTNQVKIYDIEINRTTKICYYSGTWEPLYYEDDKFYLKNVQEGELICVHASKNSVETSFANKNMDYISPHYATESSESVLSIYDVDAKKVYDVSISKDIYFITANKEGLVAKYGKELYFYRMEDEMLLTFELSDEVNNVFIHDGHLLVLTQQGEMYILTEEDAIKVSKIPFIQHEEDIGSHQIDVKEIAQNPDYPTGCEIISTIMLLDYIDKEIDPNVFIDYYLKTSKITFDADETMYAPSPYDAFVGDPRSEAAYGCMAPVIEQALIDYLGTDKYVVNTTGSTLKSLCTNYIKNDIPVLVWATIGMVKSYPTSTWITPTGESYTWPANEHCLLLVGYDDYCYYFNDPWTGKLTAYSRSVCERRYEELGMQSLTVLNP